MKTTTAPRLADWLLSQGRTSTTTAEAAELLGVPVEHVRVRLARPVADQQLFSPSRGMWVPIPPEFRSWGVTPASHFLADLMRHLGRDYYLGWLSAAEIHGAAHQRPQVTQIAVDQPLADRDLGRVRLRFYTRQLASVLPRQQHRVPTGQVWVATPELTALDLTDRPDRGGGINNVATVLSELSQDTGLSAIALAELSHQFPVAAGRRLGYLLDNVDAPIELDLLRAALAGRPLSRPPALTPQQPRRGTHDKAWDLLVNTTVEPDL